MYYNNLKYYDAYRLMAKFLLEGKVVKDLSKYTPSLLSMPIVMVKPWGNLHGERTQILLQQLMNNDVDSRQRLIHLMNKNPNFLKDAYLKWIPESLRHEVCNLWPRINT